jgi:hypothetical protein
MSEKPISPLRQRMRPPDGDGNRVNELTPIAGAITAPPTPHGKRVVGWPW